MSDNSGDDVLKYFLFRSLVIGAAVGIPAAFFSPTRRVLRFLMTLDVIQGTADLVQLAIVFTLLGLILQGLFHLLRSGLGLRKPKP